MDNLCKHTWSCCRFNFPINCMHQYRAWWFYLSVFHYTGSVGTFDLLSGLAMPSVAACFNSPSIHLCNLSPIISATIVLGKVLNTVKWSIFCVIFIQSLAGFSGLKQISHNFQCAIWNGFLKSITFSELHSFPHLFSENDKMYINFKNRISSLLNYPH